MIERRGRARLVLEPLAQVLVRPRRRAQHLQRDRPLQLRIVREIHLAHAADSEERADLVTAELGAGLEQEGDSSRWSAGRAESLSYS